MATTIACMAKTGHWEVSSVDEISHFEDQDRIYVLQVKDLLSLPMVATLG